MSTLQDFREAFPDLVGPPYFALADRVYATGEPTVLREVRVTMARDAGEGVFNAIYHPLRDAAGRVIVALVGLIVVFAVYFGLSALPQAFRDLGLVRALRYALLVVVAAELVPALLRRWLPRA